MTGDGSDIISFDRILQSDCIIFDLDGTLCDSIGDIEKCFLRAFSRCKLPPPNLARLRIGPPLREMTEALLQEETDPTVIDAVVEHFRYLYNTCDFNASPLYPGCTELLKRIHDADKPMAIATLKREQPTLRLLEKHEIAPLFVSVHCCDSVGRMWTKKEMLESILASTNLRPEKCLFFGDSTGDISAGTSLGVPTVAVTCGYGDRKELLEANPDYLLDTWKPNSETFLTIG